MMIARTFAILLVACLLVANVAAKAERVPTPQSPYEQKCGEMIKNAQQAAAAFNRPQTRAKAEEYVAAVYKAFEDAKALEPKNPQAYANMAIFLSNTHKYDEAMEMFDSAISCLGDSPDEAKGKTQLELAKRKAEYDKYSMMRDKAYERGNGNVVEAHKWALKQLEVTRDPHVIRHELATLEAMLCEYDEKMCAESYKNFEFAHQISQNRYSLQNQPEDKDFVFPCMRSKLFVGNFSEHPNVTSTEIEGAEGAFYNKIGEEPAATIWGHDGIMTIGEAAKGQCAVLNPASDYFANLAQNLFPGRPIENGIAPEKLFSLVRFSSGAFYHWMAEALPAVVLYRKHLGEEAFAAAMQDTWILMPADAKADIPRFAQQSMQILLDKWGVKPRLVPHIPNVVAGKGLELVTWPEQPCPDGTMGCASIPHPAGLRATREALVDALGPLDERQAMPYVLLAARGKGVSMRNYNEDDLMMKLIDAATNYGAGVRKFVAANHNFRTALQMFREAVVVVGVHGGALSNIVACSKGTKLVEVGFNTKAARHYESMAKSLDMGYTFVPVSPDDESKQRALGAKDISFDYDEVIQAVKQALQAIAEADRAEL